jgi:hypothetical protein
MTRMLHVLNLNLGSLGGLSEVVNPFFVFFEHLCELDEQWISVCKFR